MKNEEPNPRDSGVLSGPLSFLRNGLFGWHDSYLYNRSGGGYYWSLHSFNTTVSYGLYFDNTGLSPQGIYHRGYGFAVCCVSNINGLVVSLPILYVQKAGNYLLTQVTNPSPLSLILAII